jgi:non-homologous end joining protein Ku
LAGDRYHAALRQMVERKVEGQKPAAVKARLASGNVGYLMDALKRRLEADQARGGGEQASGLEVRQRGSGEAQAMART